MVKLAEDCLAHYTGVKMLGEGSFGKVWLVTHDENPGKTFALKMVDWDQLDEMGTIKGEQMRDQLTAEVDFLTNCKHEHIIGEPPPLAVSLPCSARAQCITACLDATRRWTCLAVCSERQPLPVCRLQRELRRPRGAHPTLPRRQLRRHL